MLTPLKKSAIIACFLVELEERSHQDSVSVSMYDWTLRTDVTANGVTLTLKHHKSDLRNASDIDFSEDGIHRGANRFTVFEREADTLLNMATQRN